jgi:putative spermidine/putrescine transport system permease protein
MAQAEMVGMPGALVSADGTSLKASLRRADRRRRITAFLLVTPLLAFIVITFVMPIGDMLWRSVENQAISENLPRTIEALDDWDGEGLPPESVYAAMVQDLREGRDDRSIGSVGIRLNYEMSGARSLINSSVRKAERLEPPYKESLGAAHRNWRDPEIWRIIQRESRSLTASYYVSGLDLRYAEDGSIVRQPPHQRIYVDLYLRTLLLSVVITALTLLLGFPIAYLLATLPMRYSNLLMILVLLPFWTSLLVRTTAWIVLLQQQGVVNEVLVATGLISEDGRLQMIHNWIGTLIAMTHILLPFMVLPLYSVMKGIPPSYMRAARSLGATPWTAFWKVYVPQTVPGIGAGGVLVFIISIGYYITPALVGGQSGQMISNLIAYHMQKSLNWGLGAALGSMLLAGVLILYWAYSKFFGTENVKLG